jgi:hypothetical protein
MEKIRKLLLLDFEGKKIVPVGYYKEQFEKHFHPNS